MSMFSAFPPQLQGPQIQGSPSVTNDATTQQFLADLLAGTKKKEYKNIGSALIGTLFNAIGAGAELLGVKGAGSIGTDLFGQTKPEANRDLAYLLVHLMGTKQAEQQMRQQFLLESKRIDDTNKTHLELQRLEGILKEKMQRSQQAFEAGQTTQKLAAAEKAQTSTQAFEATQNTQKIEAQKAMQDTELQSKSEQSSLDRLAHLYGIQMQGQNQQNVATIEAGGRLSAAQAAHHGSEAEQTAEAVSNAMSGQLASAWRGDKPDAGTSIIQDIPSLVGDQRFANLLRNGVPIRTAADQAGLLDQSGQKGQIVDLVHKNLLNQAPGSVISPEDMFGKYRQAAVDRASAVANTMNKQPAIMGDAKTQVAMQAVMGQYLNVAGQMSDMASQVYGTEYKKLQSAQPYAQNINGILSVFSGPPPKAAVDAYQTGQLRTKVNELASKYTVTGDQLFNPSKAKQNYEDLIKAVSQDPILNSYYEGKVIR